MRLGSRPIVVAPGVGDGDHSLVRRSPHLVLRFAVLSFVALVLAATGIIWYVHHDATARAHREVARDAVVASTLLLNQGITVSATDLDVPVTGLEKRALDADFETKLLGSVADSVSLYSPGGVLTYSHGTAPPGPHDKARYQSGGPARRATAAEVAAALETPQVLGTDKLSAGAGRRSGMEVVSVLVPIRFQKDARSRGVFQLEQDPRIATEGIGGAVRRIALVLGAGLLAIYASLFPILASASRRLRVQSAVNERLALHDSLTGLPNRTLFRDRVSQGLLAARRGGLAPAVMLMDLDRFKEINDTLGHQAGDRVLEEVARRLTAALRETDTIARLGGDEFAILLPGVRSQQAAVRVARVVQSALDEPVGVQDMALSVEASIGIALSPDHGEDVDALLRCADVAMYRAKGSGTGYAVYTPEGEEGARDRLRMAAELRRAPGKGEIEVHYQPKACLATGRVSGVEALARWRHPRLGLLGPDAFIAMAEQTGAIRRLTLDILAQSLGQCRSWSDGGYPVPVAVNLSALHLLDSELPRDVARALDRAGVAPAMLELEITEGAVMANPVRAMEVIERLRRMGVRLAIDDFGVGHSSLGQLADMPVHVLKIDRSLISDLTPGSRAAMIVGSTIELGRNLGLEVVGEGVETAEGWEELRRLGCDVAQGYLISHPVPAGEIEPILLGRGIRAVKTPDRSRSRSRLRWIVGDKEADRALAGGPRLPTS